MVGGILSGIGKIISAYNEGANGGRKAAVQDVKENEAAKTSQSYLNGQGGVTTLRGNTVPQTETPSGQNNASNIASSAVSIANAIKGRNGGGSTSTSSQDSGPQKEEIDEKPQDDDDKGGIV